MDGLQNLLKGKNRLLLMAFAILWIVGFHYAMYGNLLRFGIFEFLFGKGYLGVDIFFFLSAYGLCFSFSRHSLKEYYSRRIKKLYPIYLLFLGLFVIFFSSGYAVPWYKAMLLQVTGLVSFTNIDIEWFVPALTLLYLLFPLLYKGLEKVYGMGFWASAVLVALLAVTAPSLARIISPLFSPRLVIIVVGVFSFFAVRDGRKEYLTALYLVCALLGFCFLGNERINVSQTGTLLLPAVLFLLSQMNLSVPDWKPLDFIGSHTLEIYLAQNLAFNHFMATSDKPFFQNSLISFGIVILGTVLFYLFQEKFYSFFSKSDR